MNADDHLGAMSKLKAARAAAGKRIDPDNANVWFEYGQILDPYGDCRPMPLEYDCVGRVWFASDAYERVAVEWGDLAEATAAALEEKRREADAEGWRQILWIRSCGSN